MNVSEVGMSYSKMVDVYEALDSTTKRLEKTTILAKFFAILVKKILNYFQ